MVSVLLEGHDFRYEVEDIIRLFFSEDGMEWINERPSAESRGIFIISRLFESGGRLETEASLESEGSLIARRIPIGSKLSIDNILPINSKLHPHSKPVTDSKLHIDGKHPINSKHTSASSLSEDSRLPQEFSHDGKDSHELRKLLKREVKRCLYLVLEAFTGRSLPWGILTGIRPSKIVHELLDAGKGKEEILNTLNCYYRISGSKAGLLYKVAQVEKDILDKSAANDVSIYIGIPFCTSRCLYCSFTSNLTSRYGHATGRYIDCLKREMAGVLELLAQKGCRIRTIYIGGGTPTAIDKECLADLLSFIEGCINTRELAEYTLEAGRPDTIIREKLETIRSSGVTRISINPQTMNDRTLELIGRRHTSTDVVNAFRAARGTGFSNINMDLIVGLPGENLQIFRDTLERVGELGPESLTVHTMSLKRASRLMEEREKYRTVPEEEAAQMVEAAYEHASALGMHPYYLYRQKNILGNLENVGYCKPGFEGIYNIQIMEERQSIIALGAGAVTKVVFPTENRIERVFNVKDLEGYMSRVDEMVERKRALLKAE